jgi:hypothetical protein
MAEGLVQATEVGTPQGALLSLCGQKTQMSLFPFIYGSPHLGFSS